MPHEDYCYALERENHALNEEIESLRQQLEIERMRNVACDVVAMADTPTSAEEARKMLPDYRSAALESVIRRVDECIALRQQLATLKTELKSIGEAIDDPRTDLIMTMSEIILEYKQQLAAALAACKEKDEVIKQASNYIDVLGGYSKQHRQALAIQPDDSALKDKAMTTYEQPKDWIERHLVEDPGGLLACEPSGLNEELKLARQANEAQHQQLAAAIAACKRKDEAIRALSFSAQLSGGVAGRDDDLCAAIADAETALAIQPDDSALQTFAEKVREQCAEICDLTAKHGNSAHYAAAAIRHLKELPK